MRLEPSHVLPRAEAHFPTNPLPVEQPEEHQRSLKAAYRN
jgi:hypothetical protein